MKRPDGFDRAPAAARRPSDSGRRRGDDPDAVARPGTTSATLERERTAERQREIEPIALREPISPATPPAPRPSRVRSAKAELRAAERARRREERAEVRRFTRRSRRRRIAWLTTGTVLLTLVLMVVAAVYSPLLSLRHIRVEGTSRLDASQVRDAVSGQLGTPLALLNSAELKRELGAFSLIRSFSTEIVPPDTVIIRVVERTPVAALQSGTGYELVDAAGVTVASSEGRPSGVPVIDLAPSQGVDSAGFAAMARVLSSLPPALLARVDTVTARTGDDVSFTLTGTAQTVVWGSDDRPQQKAEILEHIPQFAQGQAGTFDVASEGTATFSAGS